MLSRLLPLAAFLAALFLGTSVQAAAQAVPPEGIIPDQYIVVLREEVLDPLQVANEMAQQYGLSVTHVYQHALKGFAARIPSQSLAAVRADGRVLSVSEDRSVQAVGEPAPPDSGR